MKKRHGRKRTGLLVIAAILVLFAAGILWQLPNLKALTMAMQYSALDLEQMEADDQRLSDALMERMDDEMATPLKPLDEEDHEKLKSGELSVDDAVALMTGDVKKTESSGSQEKPQTQAPQQPSKVEPVAPAKDGRTKEEHRIAELVAKLYALRSSYSAEVDRIESNTRAAFFALPPEERRMRQLTKLAFSAVDDATALEKSCDAQVAKIAGELKALLRKTGGDESIAQDIKYAYAQEKSIKKAYLMNKYSKYLEED